LRVDRGHDAAGVAVEAHRLAVVTDALDRVAHDRGDLDVGGGRDLTRHDGETGRHHGLAGDPGHRVLGEDRVEDRVADLVGHLVGMAFGHGLGREGPTAHDCFLLSRTAVNTARAMARLSANGTSRSVPSASRITTWLVSCSNPAPGAVTSLATIRSAPLATSLEEAFCLTRSVSAANPTRVCPGRWAA